MTSRLECGLPLLDAALSSLLDDLEQRGMLETTLVAVLSEFGRTPRAEKRGGRDHYSRAFSVLLAGGGIKTGLVVGRTDAQGAEVSDCPVSRGDLLATICTALGIGADTEFSREGRLLAPNRGSMSATGAPVRLFTRDANPVRELL